MHVTILLVEKFFVFHNNVFIVLDGPEKVSDFFLASVLVKLHQVSEIVHRLAIIIPVSVVA